MEKSHFDSIKWAHKYIKWEDILAVETAVAQAEKRSQVEIVTVVADRSIGVGHVFPLVWIGLAIAVWTAMMVLNSTTLLLEDAWVPAIWIELLAALASGIPAQWVARQSGIQRWLTSDHDESVAVARAGELEFFRRRTQDTVGRTGVLVFVSLVEHRVLLRPDEGLAAKVPAEFWTSVVQGLLPHFRRRDLGAALTQAVREIADETAKHFPVSEGSTSNELSDRLLFRQSP